MRTLYLWGGWVWFFRLLALVAYGTGLLVFIGGSFLFRAILREPSLANLLLLLLWLALMAVWTLWAWVTWRNGQTRAVKIEYDPKEGLVFVRNLNFLTRRIPLELLEEAHVQSLGQSPTTAGYSGDWYYDAMMNVPVQGQLPVRIDTDGTIYDRELFKEVFGKIPPEPPKGEWSKRRRRRQSRKEIK